MDVPEHREPKVNGLVKPGREDGILFCAVLLFIGLMSALAIQAPVDDAYIVFRYADRFLRGQGLTFNDGECVEGFTSLLWTVLLAQVSRLGLSLPSSSVLINYCCLLAAALCLNWLLSILKVSSRLRLFALFLFGTSVIHFKVIYLGLELGLFTSLVLLTLCVFLKGVGFPKVGYCGSLLSPMSLGVLGGALFMTRPESVFLLPTLLLFLCLFSKPSPRRTYFLYCSLGCYFLLLVSVTLWRLGYYGEWLPNSVLAKSLDIGTLTDGFLRRKWITGSLKYLASAYLEHPSLLLSWLALGLTLFRSGLKFPMLVLYAPIFWQHVVIIENGGDWMPYFRFVNVHAPLYISALVLTAQHYSGLKDTSKRIALVGFSGLHLFGNLSLMGLDLPPPVEVWSAYSRLGSALNPVWQKGDVLAAEAIGRIGWAGPDLHIFDPAGLTQKSWRQDDSARRSVYGRSTWRDLEELKPAMIVMHFWHPELKAHNLEDYGFYCLPPPVDPLPNSWAYVLLNDRSREDYGTVIESLGAIPKDLEEVVEFRGKEASVCRPGASADPGSGKK